MEADAQVSTGGMGRNLLKDRIAALEERNQRLLKFVGQVSQIRIMPDAAMNRTTISAIKKLAEAALAEEE